MANNREPLSLENFREIIGTKPNPALVIWNLVAAYIDQTENRIIDAEFKATDLQRQLGNAMAAGD